MTILVYHAVDPSSSSSLSVAPAAFAAQAWWLSRFRRVRPLSEVLGRSSGRSVAITFDDGLRSVHEHAFPILASAGLPGAVFVVTKTLVGDDVADWIDEPWMPPVLTADQILEMRATGVEIGSHSHTHVDLTDLSEEECAKDLRRSREILEDLLHERVDMVAYPRGLVNDAVVRAAARAGFRFGLAMSGRRHRAGRLAIPRAGVYREDGSLEFALKTSPLALRLRTSAAFAVLSRNGASPRRSVSG